MAGAAVLLEEWLQELAALAQVIYKRMYFYGVCLFFYLYDSTGHTKSANKQMMQLFLLALMFYKFVHKKTTFSLLV